MWKAQKQLAFIPSKEYNGSCIGGGQRKIIRPQKKRLRNGELPNAELTLCVSKGEVMVQNALDGVGQYQKAPKNLRMRAKRKIWDPIAEKLKPKQRSLFVWAMPNSHTFEIKPIRELILSELTDGMWIDPFANRNKFVIITNNLSTEFDTTTIWMPLIFRGCLKIHPLTASYMIRHIPIVR